MLIQYDWEAIFSDWKKQKNQELAEIDLPLLISICQKMSFSAQLHLYDALPLFSLQELIAWQKILFKLEAIGKIEFIDKSFLSHYAWGELSTDIFFQLHQQLIDYNEEKLWSWYQAYFKPISPT